MDKAEPVAPKDMTRDEARARWDASGLTYAILSWPNINKLEEALDRELMASGLMRGTFRVNRRKTRVSKPPHFGVEIMVKSHYFDNREATTFNSDGFIGFAGWSDNVNVQPILRGFVSWVEEMKG